jgi:hypothetical protein
VVTAIGPVKRVEDVTPLAHAGTTDEVADGMSSSVRKARRS